MMANHLVKPDIGNSMRPGELKHQIPDASELPSLGNSDSHYSENSQRFYKDEALKKYLNDISKGITLKLFKYTESERSSR